VLLCCLLQVNWLKRSMVNVSFVEVLNNSVYGVYFDILHVFWIWQD